MNVLHVVRLEPVRPAGRGGGLGRSKLAALDEGLDQVPQAHIFVRSVAPWEILPEDDLPRFDTRP